jgi:hypothetical protein
VDIGGIHLATEISLGNVLTLICMIVAAVGIKGNIERSQAVLVEKHEALELRLENSNREMERRLNEQSDRYREHENRDLSMFASMQAQLTTLNGNVHQMIGQFQGSGATHK